MPQGDGTGNYGLASSASSAPAGGLQHIVTGDLDGSSGDEIVVVNYSSFSIFRAGATGALEPVVTVALPEDTGGATR